MTPDEKIPEPVRQGSFLFAFISEDSDPLRGAAPCNMTNITCVDERYHACRGDNLAAHHVPTIEPHRPNGITMDDVL